MINQINIDGIKNGWNLHVYTYDNVVDCSFTGKHAESDMNNVIKLFLQTKDVRNIIIQKIVEGDIFYVKEINK